MLVVASAQDSQLPFDLALETKQKIIPSHSQHLIIAMAGQDSALDMAAQQRERHRSTAVHDGPPPASTPITAVSMAVGDSASSGDLDFSISPHKNEQSSAKPPRAGVRSASASAGKRGRTNSEPTIGGRQRGLGPDSPWPDDQRAVHRRIRIDADGSTTATLQGLGQQLAADREHMSLLKETIEGIYKAQRREMTDVTALTQRMDKLELTNDQVRLNVVREINQVKSDVRGEIEQINADMRTACSTEIPKLISDRVEQAISKMEASDTEARKYLEKLDQDRPAEGQTLVKAFGAMYSDLRDLKDKLGQYEQRTEFKIQAAQGATPYTAYSLTPEKEAGIAQMHDDVRSLKAMALNVNQDTMDRERTRINYHDVQIDSLLANLKNLTGHSRIGVLHAFNGTASPPTSAPPGVDTSSQARVAPVDAGGTGLPADDGSSSQARQSAGGGSCHCPHLDQLAGRVSILEARARQAGNERPGADGRQPFLPGMRAHGADDPAHAGVPGVPGAGVPGVPGAPFDPMALIPARQLGLITSEKYQERALFDDKVVDRQDMRFDGGKNGPQWKSAVEFYMSSKCPLLLELLKWAEQHGETEVLDSNVDACTGTFLDPGRREFIQCAIFGFLTGCLRGAALTMVKAATVFNGLDAWRRVIRIIDNGLPHQLEDLRSEVRTIHLRPMKDIENVHTGIAEFDDTLRRYHEAGGTGWRDAAELKSDLMAILPLKMKEDPLVLQAKLSGATYHEFANMVRAQASQLIFNRRPAARGGLHAVEDPQPEGQQPQGTMAALLAMLQQQCADEQPEAPEPPAARSATANVEEMLAAILRSGGKGGGKGGRRDGEPTMRGPRKCAN